MPLLVAYCLVGVVQPFSGYTSPFTDIKGDCEVTALQLEGRWISPHTLRATAFNFGMSRTVKAKIRSFLEYNASQPCNLTLCSDAGVLLHHAHRPG